MRDSDFVERLRTRRPPNRTSTWDQSSRNAIFGAAVEIVVRDRVQQTIDSLGLRWTAERHGHASVCPFDLGAMPIDPEAAFAVENAYGGDIYVVDHRGSTRFTIEAKGSDTYPGFSINDRELSFSEATYVVAVTTAGLWACTMAQARLRAVNRSGFWVVSPDRVQAISLTEMFR